MRVSGTINPEQKFQIEDVKDGCCTIYFFDNIQENITNGQLLYSYDMYSAKFFYRENLEQDIQENFETWLNYAKKQEYDRLAKEIREKRDKLLKESDEDVAFDRLKLDTTDVEHLLIALTEVYNSDIAKYRQALRDIPQQDGFPWNVQFPIKP